MSDLETTADSPAYVWRLTLNNGVVLYFEHRTEAEYHQTDALEAGTGSMLHPIPLPQTAGDFVAFLQEMHDALSRAMGAAHNERPARRATGAGQ